jgi:hypothetical protein
LALSTNHGGEDIRVVDPKWFLLFAEIAIAFALFGATSWYAYYTMRLTKQQKRAYLLNREIWKIKSTPRIWFSLTLTDTTKICLVASNLGGDVAQNVNAKITTGIVEFTWKWPCILPEEQVCINLPKEISHISDLGSMRFLQIEYNYLDSKSNPYEKMQDIEPMLMEEGIKAPHQATRKTSKQS